MDIKEIALKVADSLRNKVDGISHMQSNQGLVAFAEALIAEIAKQNESCAFLHEWIEYHAFGDIFAGVRCAAITSDEKPFDSSDTVSPLFTIPPTAEQIANETAEAIAAYITSGRYMVLNSGVLISAEQHTQYLKNHDIYQANAIRRGAWKEFKK